MVQWSELCPCTVEGLGFNPWSGNKDPISHAVQLKKQKMSIPFQGEDEIIIKTFGYL